MLNYYVIQGRWIQVSMCKADWITVSKDEGGICRGGLLTEGANVGAG